MSFNIVVNDFEGPFDALLQLIKKDKMDIYDINIYDITTKYLSLLKEMEQMDLEVTSEFIVIAATLIEIKSNMLLPKKKEDETSVTLEEDPRKLLINRLLEYKKYKLVAEYFKKKEAEQGISYSKKPETIDDRAMPDSELTFMNNITMLDLYHIYSELIKMYKSKMNTENTISKEIPFDVYKIEDKMNELKEKLQIFQKIKFTNIIMNYDNKIEIVVTFLALLELVKLKSVKIIQEDNFNEIYIERINEDVK